MSLQFPQKIHLDAEANARQQAVAALQTAINEEAATRAGADNTLQGAINTLDAAAAKKGEIVNADIASNAAIATAKLGGTGAVAGQVLTWNGTSWTAAEIPASGGGGGDPETILRLASLGDDGLQAELDRISAGFGTARRVGVNTNAYTITGDTALRSFNPTTVTLQQLANAFATFVRDSGRDS